MTLDPRVRDLLDRYPLDLDDDELAELRAAADRDPRLAQIMDGILEAEDLLDDAPMPLSDAGRARLDALVERTLEAKGWSADLATPAAAGDDDAKSWSADLATPAARADRPSNVVDLAARRRRRTFAWVALAAAIVVGAVIALQAGPGDPEFQPRGVPEELEGTLWVMGDARVEDGAERSATDGVTFRAVLEDGSASLVLLETQGGATHVIWPAAGAVWEGSAGPNPVGPAGRPAPYRPAGPGRAEYRLVAASPAPDVSAEPIELGVVEEWGGRVLDEVAIEWK